jgi:adenosylmethionine-8-amino-7-oxononanoate aminotransferase
MGAVVEMWTRDSLFQTAAMTQKSVEKRPRLHLAFAKSPRVKRRRRMGMMAYAAIVGTPPAETREVNAVELGKMVHKRIAET